MSKKKPTSEQQQPEKSPEHDKLLAEQCVATPWNAGCTTATYTGADSFALTVELQRQIVAVNKGDMRKVESLLVAQAFTLDAIFNDLARCAKGQEYLRQFEANLKLALRAQAQCARTLETLATIKNPPVVFAKQANVANNQQINVGTQAGPPPASQPPATPQLEHTHGTYLDAGTTAKAIGDNPAVATVAEIHRTADSRREA